MFGLYDGWVGLAYVRMEIDYFLASCHVTYIYIYVCVCMYICLVRPIDERMHSSVEVFVSFPCTFACMCIHTYLSIYMFSESERDERMYACVIDTNRASGWRD
jgi:phosphatidylserine synthase